MALVQALVGSQATVGAPSNPDIPAALKAFTDRIDVDLLGYWQAFRWQSEISSGGRISNWYSIVPTGVVVPKFATPSEAEGYYWGIDPGDAVHAELRAGLDASNVAISGSHNKISTGTILVPAGDFCVLVRVRIPSPLGATTPLFGTADTTDPFSVEVVSTGAIRAYATRSTGLITSSTGVYSGTPYKTILYQYDSAGKLGQIQYQGSVVKAYAAHDLSGHVGQAFNLGAVVDGGSQIAGAGVAFQDVAIFSSKDATTSRGLLDTWVAARAA